jgi:hypothetical protein
MKTTCLHRRAKHAALADGTGRLLELILTPTGVLLHDARTGVPIGSIRASQQLMAESHFSQRPLDPASLERAIEWTEDRIQQARLQIPEGARLCTRAQEVQILARIAGIDHGAGVLHRDAVEQVFSRLVQQAHGQLPHRQEIPDSVKVLATVVLLREILHHLGFRQIEVADHFECSVTEPPQHAIGS